MIYIRDEGGVIRNGFNFYPRRSGSVGFQFMLGRLRVQMRYAKKTGWLHVHTWIRPKPTKTVEKCIYIPGYTEELKKLYETNHYNNYWGKKYEDWDHDSENTTEAEKQLIPSNSKRYLWTPWAK